MDSLDEVHDGSDFNTSTHCGGVSGGGGKSKGGKQSTGGERKSAAGRDDICGYYDKKAIGPESAKRRSEIGIGP
jgi:hypothetical protein